MGGIVELVKDIADELADKLEKTTDKVTKDEDTEVEDYFAAIVQAVSESSFRFPAWCTTIGWGGDQAYTDLFQYNHIVQYNGGDQMTGSWPQYK